LQQQQTLRQSLKKKKKMPAGDQPTRLREGSVPLQLEVPHQYTSPLPKCVIRIDDDSVDLTQWRHKHPGGAQLLDLFHGKDATDAFYALHSKEAISQFKRMPKKAVSDQEIPRDKISRDFYAWRQQLEREGWFDRPWVGEMIRYVIPTALLLVVGWMISASHPLLAMVLLGLGMQQAGWLGHDWSHGRDTIPMIFGRFVAATSNGFSNSWWSNKHNTHHVFPNRVGIDSDVHNEPVLHLWKPSAENDVWYRRFQPLFFLGAYGFLYASWKMQSIQFVLAKPIWSERVPILVHYVLLLSMPWYVALGSIMLAGLFVAVVVTVNHQVEPMMETESEYSFVVDQYTTTRGVVCPDGFSEFFFGGMQYQLEHHLFPTMPRARYPALRPLVTKWALEHGLEHKLSGIAEIMRLNYDLICRAAVQ
jgi:fatty acid desaturase